MNRENLTRAPKFVDVDPDNAKGMSVSIASYADANFETTVVEIEKDIQVTGESFKLQNVTILQYLIIIRLLHSSATRQLRLYGDIRRMLPLSTSHAFLKKKKKRSY